MAQTVDRDKLSEILAGTGSVTAEEFLWLRKSLTSDQVSPIRVKLDEYLRGVTADSATPAQAARAGIYLYLLAQHRDAEQFLAKAKNDGTAAYVHGLVLMSLERPADAATWFAKAAEQGFDPVECKLKEAGAIRQTGRLDDAEKTLRGTGTEGARRAEYSYQMGCILADRGDTYGAIEYFERAVDMDPHHAQALFRLAGENALYGNDNEAIRHYEQALSKPPFHLGAMLNLGLLYEDRGNYPAAAFCFKRVLNYDPNHARALMYMKDIEATQEMFYDDETARNEARLQQLLDRPVTDFELSVRSRNCLASMNILSLGDLTRTTEADLLAGKNFGETSLIEIRELMAAHGLKIGQNLATQKPREQPWGFVQTPELSPQEQALMAKPVSDLNLSVRARKCMARLGITTLGELVNRTPDEMLATKNFGVTSLNEIRQQLGEVGLKLRND